jgi:hypothetical protein
MNLMVVLKALRLGTSLPNPTPFKWAGIAVSLGLLALLIAQSFGLMREVSADDWAQLVMLVLVLLAQVVTTDKVGLLPRAADPAPRVRPEPLPTRTLAAHERPDHDGFPDGPFFDQ